MTRSDRRFVAAGYLSFVLFGFVGACTLATDHPPPAEPRSAGPLPPIPSATSEAGPPAKTDAGPLPDAGGGCVTGAQLGTAVLQQIVAGAAPPPTGGAIVPGTYILTTMSTYGGAPGPSGAQGQFTLIIGASTMIIVGDRAAGPISPLAAAASTTQKYSPAGAQLFFSLVCPPTSAFVTRAGYSAVGNTLTLYKNDVDLEVYTKQ